MNKSSQPELNEKWILAERGEKNRVSPELPYGFLVEKEHTAAGLIEDTAVIFLTNSECPYRCLMCDLWKNTTDEPLAAGSIPKQIEYALKRLPAAKHIKLYNSGSFFDARAIPEEDYGAIAALLGEFETVIVESHPKLINEKCLKFRDMLRGNLEVAVGLEIADDEILKQLNKRMTLHDFSSAIGFLKTNSISSRAFILLRPPFLSEEEGIAQAMRSIDFAFNSGSGCCTIIPVRAGNGAMDKLLLSGIFTPPELKSLERVLEYGIGLKKGRVFGDTWDLSLFSDCDKCLSNRKDRILTMNLTQAIPEAANCNC